MPRKVTAKKKKAQDSRPKTWEADPGQLIVESNQEVEFEAPGEAWLFFLNEEKRPFNENPIHFHERTTRIVTNGIDQETYPYIFYLPSETLGGPDHYVEWQSPPEIIIDDSGGGA